MSTAKKVMFAYFVRKDTSLMKVVATHASKNALNVQMLILAQDASHIIDLTKMEDVWILVLILHNMLISMEDVNNVHQLV